MSPQDSSKINPDQYKHNTPAEAANGARNVDIQQELNRLEEMVLASPHIPLTRRTLVHEEQLLDQLDLVRLHLPAVFQEAQDIVQQKKEILLQAEQYARELIEAAEARAAQILNDMDIVRQAELQAKLIQQQVQQECDELRRQAQQELEEMRLRAIAESEEIQQGADEYADRVLQNIEQQLNDMLRIIRNGRQQLQPETPPQGNSP